MIGAGVLLLFGGYAVGSYGYVLVKGYNITAREWFSPLSPFTWPPTGGDVPRVPKGHIFPTASGAAQSAAAAGGSAGGSAGGIPAAGVL
jgi:hypothetical protein